MALANSLIAWLLILCQPNNVKRSAFYILVFIFSLKTFGQLGSEPEHRGLLSESSCSKQYRLGLNGFLNLLPTSKRGFTEIGNLNGQILLECFDEEGWSTHFEGQILQESHLPNTMSAFPVELQQVNIVGDFESFAARAGLMWDPWIWMSNTQFGFHLIHSDFQTLSSRTALLPRGELALQLEKQWDNFGLGFRLSSGEHWPNKAQGPNKDLMVWLQSRPESGNSLNYLVYSRVGQYDLVNQDSSVKSRFGFQLYYDFLQFKVGFTALKFSSGVDGISQQQGSASLMRPFGEGLNLVPIAGQVLHGLINELWLSYSFSNLRTQFFIRAGEANLDVDSPERSILSGDLGVSHWLSSRVKSVFYYSNTQYSGGFLLSSQDRQHIGVSLEYLAGY